MFQKIISPVLGSQNGVRSIEDGADDSDWVGSGCGEHVGLHHCDRLGGSSVRVTSFDDNNSGLGSFDGLDVRVPHFNDGNWLRGGDNRLDVRIGSLSQTDNLNGHWGGWWWHLEGCRGGHCRGGHRQGCRVGERQGRRFTAEVRVGWGHGWFWDGKVAVGNLDSLNLDLLCRSAIQGDRCFHFLRCRCECRLGSSSDSYDGRGVFWQGRSRGSHLNLLDRGDG